VSVLDAFKAADQVLLSGVQGITDLITTPGLINLDFADVKSVMSGAGSALMGIGSSRGDDRAVAAAEMAISSPLLEASIDGAHGVLLSIQGGSDLGLFEINEAAQLVANSAAVDANIIFGAVIDDALGDEVRVTVIAAGFDEARPGRPAASAPLTVSRSSGSSGSGSSSVPASAASSASAGTSAPTNGRADQNPPSASGAGQDGRSHDSRTGASSSSPSSATAAWGGTPAPSSPAPAPVTAPAVTSSVGAASADSVVAVPVQSGGDGASSGYVPSPVSFVSADSDDDEEYGGKPATSYGSWDRDRERESEAPSATGPSNWKDPGRPSKQDTVFDVTAGRRRPVVFEEDDDLDVPDFLK
jgi:cell division protein FtsZ